VSLEPVSVSGGTTEYWFSYENGVSGTPAGPSTTSTTVLESISVDTANKKIKQTSKSITVLAAGSTTTSDVHTGTDCPT
jgi:hypothetical protein